MGMRSNNQPPEQVDDAGWQPTTAYRPAASYQPTTAYNPAFDDLDDDGYYPPTQAYVQGQAYAQGGYAPTQAFYPQGYAALQQQPQVYYEPDGHGGYVARQAYAPQAAYAARPGGAVGVVPPGGYTADHAGYGHAAPQPPRKKGNASLVIAIILLVAGIAILAVAGYSWLTSQQKYDENKAEYTQLAQENVTEDTATGRPVVDFAALQAQNAEITGWIQIPGTPVNYPVVQHADNDYYLNHSFLDRYDEFGAVFMDYRSASDLSGRNTVIYGHHLKNGEMFAKVADYSDQDEFNTLSNIYYVSSDAQVHTLVPLCTIVVSGYDVDVLQFDFATQADFEAYVQSLIDRSSARSSTATASGVQRIYMLSTCSYGSDNERTILVCTDLNGTNGPVVDATQSMNEIQSAADEAAGIADDAGDETPAQE